MKQKGRKGQCRLIFLCTSRSLAVESKTPEKYLVGGAQRCSARIVNNRQPDRTKSRGNNAGTTRKRRVDGSALSPANNSKHRQSRAAWARGTNGKTCRHPRNETERNERNLHKWDGGAPTATGEGNSSNFPKSGFPGWSLYNRKSSAAIKAA